MKTINFSSDRRAVAGKYDISYAGIGNRIISLSEHFRNSGIKEGEITGILLENSIEFIVSIFALWKIKAVPAPLHTRLTVGEINDILLFSGIRSIVVTSDRQADFRYYNAVAVNTFSSDNTDNTEGTSVLLNDLIIYTSGSSGSPKGVILSADALVNSIQVSNTALKQTTEERWLASLPFYHIGGFMIFMRSFYYGGTVIFPQSLKEEDIILSVKNDNPTLLSLVPTQLHRLVSQGICPASNLRNVLLGGGSFDEDLILKALDAGWKVSPVYGMTETASFISYMPPELVKENPGSSGKPLSPTIVEIAGASFEEGDITGEITIRAESLFSGYLNDPEQTSSKLIDGKFFTGDYGYLDNNGFLFVVSRRTDLIVSGGENISPEEVEQAIKSFPGINDVCVFGKKDAEWGESVNALYVSSEDIQETLIINHLKGIVSSFKIPKQFIRVDEIPRTSLGKIRRSRIKQMFDPSNIC